MTSKTTRGTYKYKKLPRKNPFSLDRLRMRSTVSDAWASAYSLGTASVVDEVTVREADMELRQQVLMRGQRAMTREEMAEHQRRMQAHEAQTDSWTRELYGPVTDGHIQHTPVAPEDDGDTTE